MTGRILSNRAAVVLTLLVSAYVAAQMLADITSLKLTEVAGWTVDAGTVVYPITFTLRDLVHKVAGVWVARTIIVAAAVINLAMAGLFWFVAGLPSIPDVGPQSEMFGAVLAPVWRIVFASIVAEVASELIDTEVYRAWVDRVGERWQWGRVLSSNGVAIPVDSAIFVTIAFAGVAPAADVWEIFAVNVAFKGMITLVSIPLIYAVRPGRVVAPPSLR